MISVTSLVFVCWTVALVSSQDGVDMNEIEEIVEQKAYEAVSYQYPKYCTEVTNNRRGLVFLDHPIRGMCQVYCDMKKDGGGWNVFQRRVDGAESFYRSWYEYKRGFGDMEDSFWLGLEKMYRMMSDGKYELRIDMENTDGISFFVKYNSFEIRPESDKYRIIVSGFSGNAADALKYHNYEQFSTKDADNDANGSYHCARDDKGGWWYRSCSNANLNGQYNVRHWTGVYWPNDRSLDRYMKFTEMKFRRKS